MLSRSSSAYQKLDVSSAEGASACAAGSTGVGGMDTDDDAGAGVHEMTSIAVIRYGLRCTDRKHGRIFGVCQVHGLLGCSQQQ